MLLGTGVGLPIPEDVPLLAAGVLADNGGWPVPVAAAACSFFVMVRDVFVYTAGRRFGPRVLASRWGRRVVPPALVRRVEARIVGSGAAVVAVGRMTAGLRVAVFFTAGTAGVKPSTFVIVDAIMIALTVPLFVWLGFTFSSNLDTLVPYLRQFREVLLGVAALAAALWLLRRWRRGRAQS